MERTVLENCSSYFVRAAFMHPVMSTLKIWRVRHDLLSMTAMVWGKIPVLRWVTRTAFMHIHHRHRSCTVGNYWKRKWKWNENYVISLRVNDWSTCQMQFALNQSQSFKWGPSPGCRFSSILFHSIEISMPFVVPTSNKAIVNALKIQVLRLEQCHHDVQPFHLWSNSRSCTILRRLLVAQSQYVQFLALQVQVL